MFWVRCLLFRFWHVFAGVSQCLGCRHNSCLCLGLPKYSGHGFIDMFFFDNISLFWYIFFYRHICLTGHWIIHTVYGWTCHFPEGFCLCGLNMLEWHTYVLLPFPTFLGCQMHMRQFSELPEYWKCAWRQIHRHKVCLRTILIAGGFDFLVHRYMRKQCNLTNIFFSWVENTTLISKGFCYCIYFEIWVNCKWSLSHEDSHPTKDRGAKGLPKVPASLGVLTQFGWRYHHGITGTYMMFFYWKCVDGS